MKKIQLLTVWKWVIILFQFISIIIPFLFLYASFQKKDNGSDLVTVSLDVDFMPEERDIIVSSDEVYISFPKDDNVKPKVVIEKTKLYLENAVGHMRIPSFIILSLVMAVLIFGLEQLKIMIRTVEAGNPLIRSNVWRIYILASLLFLFPLASKLSGYLSRKWVMNNFEFSGVRLLSSEVNMVPWFLSGILLITLGKIIEKGIEIKNEQDLTI
ncbi:MAG: DUF2975 domain-containing protein [Cyclobacteriaceae bacterium]